MGISVLIVDDNALVRKALSDLLLSEFNNISIYQTATGSEAVQFVKEKSPQLVLLDLHMPEMDGFETCVKILDWKKNIRIILFTLHNDEVLAEKALEMGASGYLDKNAPIRNILDTVRSNLDREMA